MCSGFAFEHTEAELESVTGCGGKEIGDEDNGVAGEKRIVDVKELAGTWQGWVTRDDGRERVLRYRSSRTTGTASLSEDQGKTVLRVMSADPTYGAGSAEYERVE